MDKGFNGEYDKLLDWLNLLITHRSTLVALFKDAYSRNCAVEASIVLSSIRCGLYSSNQQIVGLSLNVLTEIAKDLYKAGEIMLQTELPGKKRKINQAQKTPVFRFLQEWFIRSKKTNDPRDRYQRV